MLRERRFFFLAQSLPLLPSRRRKAAAAAAAAASCCGFFEPFPGPRILRPVQVCYAFLVMFLPVSQPFASVPDDVLVFPQRAAAAAATPGTTARFSDKVTIFSAFSFGCYFDLPLMQRKGALSTSQQLHAANAEVLRLQELLKKEHAAVAPKHIPPPTNLVSRTPFVPCIFHISSRAMLRNAPIPSRSTATPCARLSSSPPRLQVLLAAAAMHNCKNVSRFFSILACCHSHDQQRPIADRV
jgi:hypothetical protein